VHIKHSRLAKRRQMASASFRENMNSLGWSRRDQDTPVRTDANTPILSRIRSLNPFGSGEGYLRLPTQEPGAPLPAPSRREEEESFFARMYSTRYLWHGFLLLLPAYRVLYFELVIPLLDLPLRARVIPTQFLRAPGFTCIRCENKNRLFISSLIGAK
jgi:hypothetical protein